MRHSRSVAWSLLRSVAWSLALVAPMGCGGSAPPKAAAPQESAAAESAPPPPSAVTPVVLTPVSAPRGVFFWGRIKNPASLVDSVVAATAIPLNWRAELERESPELLGAIALDSPVEVAVALDDNPAREPNGIVSFGVSSEDAVMTELERQGIQVRTVGDAERWFSVPSGSCALGPSLGPTPVRVVCSDDDESLAALLPYALRGLSTETFSDAEAHFELRAAPLKQTYKAQIRSLKLLASMLARQLEIDSPRFDRAVGDTVLALADEGILLAQDLDSLTFDLHARDGGDYELAFTGKFEGSASWTASSLGLLGQSQTAPPDAFWKLPADTSVGSFGHALSRERSRPIYDTLIELLGGYLEHEGLTDKTRVRIEKSLRELVAYEGIVVSSTGPIRSLSTPQGEEVGPAWQIVGIEANAAGYKKQLDELSRALASADVRKLAKDEDFVPELTSRGALAGRPGSAVYEWKLSGEWGSLLDTLTPRAKRGLGPALRFKHGFLAVVPDGPRTWFAWATEREALADPFDVLFKTSSPRLDSVAGLNVLRDTSTVASGFIKLEAAIGPFLAELDPNHRTKNWDTLSRSLPYGGKIPATFHMRVEGGSAPSVQVVERIPHQLVADLTALIVRASTGR